MNRRRFIKTGLIFVPSYVGGIKLIASPQQVIPRRGKAFQAGAAAGGGSFTYYATAFDGVRTITDEKLQITGDLTGISDGKRGLFSCWIKWSATGFSSESVIFSIMVGGQYYFSLEMDGSPDDFIRFYGENSSGTAILHIYAPPPASSGVWYHVIASWDLATAGNRRIYVDGSDQTNQLTFTNDNLNYASGGFVRVAADNGLGNLFIGSLCELYFTVPASYYDLSNSTNRLKFRTAGGKPENLGSDGSTPTGTQPLVYLKNPFGTFQNNAGSGGNFAVTGTLADDASIP